MEKIDQNYNLNDMVNCIQEEKDLCILIKLFSDSNLNLLNFHIINKNKDINKTDKLLETITILFRYTTKASNLYYLLSDFSGCINIGMQTSEEIYKLNKELNPSIEIKEIDTLISFLCENLFVLNKNTKFLYDCNKESFIFESLIEIIKVKWEISTVKFENKKNVEFLRNCLFIQPFLNVFFSYQQSAQNSIGENKQNEKKTKEESEKIKNVIKEICHKIPVLDDNKISKFSNELIIDSTILLSKAYIFDYQKSFSDKEHNKEKKRNSKNKRNEINDIEENNLKLKKKNKIEKKEDLDQIKDFDQHEIENNRLEKKKKKLKFI